MSKPLQPYTNAEILVKIAPLVSELRGLESRALKKILKNKKYRKNIGKIYSRSGKSAERAKKEEELNASKIYRPIGNLAEWAK